MEEEWKFSTLVFQIFCQFMNLSSSLQQIQSQHLSPLMIRSLNILQLPIRELQQLISTEIQCNPLLDITINDSLNKERTHMHNTTNNDDGMLNLSANIFAERSPQDYLLDQVPDIDELTETALIMVINSLDESGTYRIIQLYRWKRLIWKMHTHY
jgi:DNA-directed RNA polymerase specialized sigma54-like protein